MFLTVRVERGNGAVFAWFTHLEYVNKSSPAPFASRAPFASVWAQTITD